MFPKRRPFRPNTSNHRGRSSRFSKGRPIDPSMFVKKAVVAEDAEQYIPQNAFSDFMLSDQLKQNIAERGYPQPTPIQDQSIPVILTGQDVLGIANTGTGKTAAFLLPLINKISLDRNQKVLIIVPTRELAVQIEDEFRLFARNMQLYSVLCIGGANMQRQIREINRGVHFVIGTPGRLKDLEQHNKIHFSDYSTIVLDEVDRMFDMGFITDIKYIIGKLPTKRHSLFFSATVPPSMTAIIHQFLHNPVTISIKTQRSSENVNQDVIRTRGKVKIDVLHDLLIQKGFDKVLLFGRTKWGIEKLSKELVTRGFKVAAIHGNKKQTQRQRALDAFKSSEIQVLLATDIASRGIDVTGVTHVINYDPPESYEDYIHRIGRTGRANAFGTALTFVD